MLCRVKCSDLACSLILVLALFLIPAVSDAGSLRIGPIPGLTTVWHVAPETMSIPVGTTLTFKTRVPAGASLAWTGATELVNGDWSFAECSLDETGSYTVRVTTVFPNGSEVGESVVIDVVATTVEQIRVSPIRASVAAVTLDPSDLNASTQEYFFGSSIAELRKVSSTRYRTSTNRPVRLSVEVEPASFASLMEWRIPGRPPRLGRVRQVSHQVPARQWIEVGPPANSPAVFLETYRVKITSHVSDHDVIPQGVPVTFTALTEPSGYEDEITWLASTKYGSSDPVLGQGPEFTVRFYDTWGPHPLFDEPFQWLGVKADGTVYNQDQKPRDLPPFETGCCDCGKGPATDFQCESESCGGPDSAGDSVYLFSGEYYQSAVDLRIRGRGPDFVWARKYRSRLGPYSDQGNGWDFSYNIRLASHGPDLVLFDGNTRKDVYSPSGSVWTAPEFYRELSQNPDGSYTLTFADTGTWNFHPLDGSPEQGNIESIVDRNGNALGFAYDAAGRLIAITDTLDRDIHVAYNGDGFVESVTDFAGRQVRYEYYQDGDAGGSFGDLESVTTPTVVGTPNGNDFPAGKTTRYTYTTGFADENLNHNLLTVTDPKGQTYLRNVYSETTDPTALDYDRVRRQIWGDPGDVLDFVYVSQTPSAENNWATSKAIVNDRVGNVEELFFDVNRNVLQREYTGRADPDQPTTDKDNRPMNPLRADDPPFFETRWEYNADARATREVDTNGNEMLLTYDDGNPSRRSHGNVMQGCRVAGPLEGDQAMICESYEYDDGFGGCCGTNFVTRHVDGRGNETLHEYDAVGNRIHTQHRIPSIVEDFEYNAFGQRTAHVLPDNGGDHRRRDEYTYYESGPQRGYLQSEIIDAPGFALTTTTEYDLVGNEIRITDPEGHDTQYVYNALDQVVRELSPTVDLPGGAVRYETDTFYDANDNVVRIDVQNIDEGGQVPDNTHFTTVYEYEILNHRIASCQEVGDYTGAIPSPPELPTCQGLPDADFLRMEYAYDGNRNRVLERKGEAVEGRQPANVVSTLYDERDLLFRVIHAPGHPDQSTTQYDYDPNRNLRRTLEGIESTPRVNVNTYDGYDRLVGSVDPMGNVMEHHYDPNHNRVQEITFGELIDVEGSDGNIRLTEAGYAFDTMDRQIRSELAFFDTETQEPIGDGHSLTTTEWSDSSQVLRVIDDNDHETLRSYDTANRPSMVTDAKGNTVTTTYDADSLIVAVTEVENSDLGRPDEVFTNTRTFDSVHRLTRTVDNVGNTHAFGYDSRHNRTLTVDALDHQTRNVYDGVNRLVATIRDLDDDGADGDGPDITTTQGWDDTSRLATQGDDNGNLATYLYDPLDRLVAEAYADGTVHSYDLDVHDNRIFTRDANETEVKANYDLLDRLVRKDVEPGPGVSADTTFETFGYDGLSRLASAADDDSLVTRSYDSLSRVTRETLNGQLTTSLYDGVGNKLRCIYPSGRVVTTVYDELDRKKIISDSNGLIAEYLYVGPGRVEQREYGNGTRTDYSYNGIQGVPNPPNDFGVKRIIRTRHTRIGDGLVIDDRTYTWDRMYNKIQRKDVRVGGPGFVHDYSYDPIYRLVRTVATDPKGVVFRDEQYDLDGVGNRTNVTGGENPGIYVMDGTLPDPGDSQMNQYTSTSFDGRMYDRNGNLISADGSQESRAVVYDYRNQMVEHSRFPVPADGNSERGNILSHYSYDALGRRITKVVDVGDVSGGLIETRFFYDGWQVTEEQDSNGEDEATYVYGLYIDEVLNMQRVGVDYYYYTDDLYNVMAITDAVGAVGERYEYADYGQPLEPSTLAPIVKDTLSVANPYRFTGRRYDTESRWHFYRTRYLDPVKGKFISRDIIGLWGDPINVGNGYSYTGNSPWTGLDPLGLAWLPAGVGSRKYESDNSLHVFIVVYEDWECIFKEETGCGPESTEFSDEVTVGISKTEYSEIQSKIGSSIGKENVASVSSELQATTGISKTMSTQSTKTYKKTWSIPKCEWWEIKVEQYKTKWRVAGVDMDFWFDDSFFHSFVIRHFEFRVSTQKYKCTASGIKTSTPAS